MVFAKVNSNIKARELVISKLDLKTVGFEVQMYGTNYYRIQIVVM